MLCFVGHTALQWAWMLLNSSVMLWWTNVCMSQQCYTMLMMLQCCLCPYSACCDLHAAIAEAPGAVAPGRSAPPTAPGDTCAPHVVHHVPGRGWAPHNKGYRRRDASSRMIKYPCHKQGHPVECQPTCLTGFTERCDQFNFWSGCQPTCWDQIKHSDVNQLDYQMH